MEVFGTKAHLNIEKQMDKRYKKFVAVLFIQRVYRGYLVRKRMAKKNLIMEFAKVFANIMPESD
jgi:hypothetical protein